MKVPEQKLYLTFEKYPNKDMLTYGEVDIVGEVALFTQLIQQVHTVSSTAVSTT